MSEAGASRAAPRGARRPRPLLLRTMSGRLRSVESRPGDTVAGLLAEVSRRERSERLELRYGGRRLEESRTLSSYGLRAMSELQLWERGGGLLGGGLCLSTSCEDGDEVTERVGSQLPTGSDHEELEANSEASSSGSSSRSHSRSHSRTSGESCELEREDSDDSTPGAPQVAPPAGREAFAPVRSEPASPASVPEWDFTRPPLEFDNLVRLFVARDPPRGPILGTVPAVQGDGIAALLAIAALQDLPLQAVMTPGGEVGEIHQPGFDGLYYSEGPHLRLVQMPVRLRLTAFDIDALSYEELLQLADELGSVPYPRATPEMLMRLPLYRYCGGEDKTCVICQEAYEMGEEVRKLPCSHTYHRACIDRWLTTGGPISLQCPICKAPAVER